MNKQQKLQELIKRNFPSFEIICKEDSILMKIISYILFFNKDFMVRYTTMVGTKMYVPKGKYPYEKNDNIAEYYLKCATLTHEFQHMFDQKGFFKKSLFMFLYFCPQIFALGAIGAIWNLWFLLFLLFLLPLPSPRAYLEYRGYLLTFAAYYWIAKIKIPVSSVVEKFTGSGYYFMGKFFGWLLEKKFNKFIKDLHSGNDSKYFSPEILEAKQILKK